MEERLVETTIKGKRRGSLRISFIPPERERERGMGL